MTAGDFKITLGTITWDLSSYGPVVNWGYDRNIEYFRFPGVSEPIILDLLDNEQTISASFRIPISDVTTQLNTGSSPTASLRSLITTIRDTGTDPNNVATLSTITWHTFGTFTVSVKSASLQQVAGEGIAYNLEVKFLVGTGPY